jgi:CRISPR-associated endonuclease/helicase Cas3
MVYPHQQHVFASLVEGKSVILRAPTGSGKTRAAIEPFLKSTEARLYGKGAFLPHKMIYSVPMRVLAKQFQVEYQKVIATFNRKKAITLDTAIQTGETPQDPELTKHLVFATIDQTLSSFLMAPYGLSRGKANLNLGAILSSYLVFDEFHLYDPDSTLPTVLQMLRMLSGITPFVLMTATFSDTLIMRLAEKLGAVAIGLSEQDRATFANLPSQLKTRRYHTQQESLSPEGIFEKHQGRTLVICNTVERARQLATYLAHHPQRGEIEIILLHSQFLPEDRNAIEDRLRGFFGKGADASGSVIVVATQAIEVGVDITCTVMHTELAPANSIIQRAGRCARYAGDSGDVYLYRYSHNHEKGDIDLYEHPNPYSGNLAKAQLPRTFEAFEQVSGHPLTFDDEQTIINVVHAEADERILNDLEADSAAWRGRMFAAMRGDERNVGDLVRNVIAQPVSVYADPDVLEEPYRLPAFNIHPGSLRGMVKEWVGRYNDLPDDLAPPFGVKYLISDTNPDDASQPVYTWQCIKSDDKGNVSVPFGTLIVVHPALASYSASGGFDPDVAGEGVPLPAKAAKEKWEDRYTYRLETYAEHIRLVYKAAFEEDAERGHSAYWHELDWGARKLAKRMGLPLEDIRRAAELTVLLHDVGKLSEGWQGWVREYQANIGMPVNPNQAYAHSERQTTAHRDTEKAMKKRRPPHAVESAVAASVVIQQLPEPLRKAVFTAISRHHGAFTEEYNAVQLERYAVEKVVETLQEPITQLIDKAKVKAIPKEQVFIVPQDSTLDSFLAYALFVRLLRRSDIRGTIWNSQQQGII